VSHFCTLFVTLGCQW